MEANDFKKAESTEPSVLLSNMVAIMNPDTRSIGGNVNLKPDLVGSGSFLKSLFILSNDLVEVE